MKVLNKTGQSSTKKCPICLHTESQEHMLLCNEPSRMKLRRTLVKNLRIKMKKKRTGYSLIEHLCKAATEWLDTGAVLVDNYLDPIQTTLKSQAKIGWYNMFRGRLSNMWLQRYESTQSLLSTEGTRPCESFVWGAKIVELLLRFHIKVWEQRNKDVHGDDENSNKDKDNFKRRQLQSEIRKLQRFKKKARPDDDFLFVHLETFLKSNTDTLRTYFKSHRKAIANSVEQQKKIKIATTGRQSIVGWLKNTATVHRTIRRRHTRRRKQAEEKEQQKALKRQQRKNRKIVDASAAVRMQQFMKPRTTVIEKVNKRTRKLKEVKERRRRARRKRK